MAGAPSAEELLAVLEELQRQGISQDQIPSDLKGLLDNVKRHKAAQGSAVPDVPTEEVTPEAGFVIKTCEVESGRKVFINVCSSDRIAAPGGWANGLMPDEVASALEKLDAARASGEDAGASMSSHEVEALRFPLACGPPRLDTDKKGAPCTSIDIIVNTDVLRAAQAARRLKHFLVQTFLGWAGKKLAAELDEKFKLPKMRYKGEVVASQRIRADDKKKPLVSELKDVEEAPSFPLRPTKAPAQLPSRVQEQRQSATAMETSTGAAVKPLGAAGDAGPSGGSTMHPAYKLEFEGRPAAWAVVTVEATMPAGAGWQGGWGVEACGTSVHVSGWGGPGQGELLVQLPFAVSGPEAGASAMVDATGRLQVRLPYRPLDAHIGDMRRSMPLPFGGVQLASNSYLELEP